MTLIRIIINWLRLVFAQYLVNKYRVYKEPRNRIKKRHLVKRYCLNILKIKINRKTMGLIISSQKEKKRNTTYVDFMWVNKKHTLMLSEDNESLFYQSMYELFIQWYGNFIKKVPKDTPLKIALSLNIANSGDVEKFRRILTLFGFNVDVGLTIEDIKFETPFREKEKITYVIYSHTL